MRFADILIDLASVAQASRGVAARHWELRARQIDQYSRTSSIVRSLRNQQQAAYREDGRETASMAGNSNTAAPGSSAPSAEATVQPAVAAEDASVKV
ncbi:hypothetical protein Micbo1qcDRAFT_160462, partial [Microdochium bolleyi]